MKKKDGSGWEPLDGEHFILQSDSLYRFSEDPVRLVHFIPLSEGSKVLEIGAGCGIISILLALKFKTEVVAVEIQKELAELAEMSVAENNLEDKITVINGRVQDLKKRYGKGTFDVVVSNPPFRPVGIGKRPRSLSREIATTEKELGLKELAEAVKYHLKDGGSFYCVHTLARVLEISDALEKAGFTMTCFKAVTPKEEDKLPKRFLLACKKPEKLL